jgi:hypothetical protein
MQYCTSIGIGQTQNSEQLMIADADDSRVRVQVPGTANINGLAGYRLGSGLRRPRLLFFLLWVVLLHIFISRHPCHIHMAYPKTNVMGSWGQLALEFPISSFMKRVTHFSNHFIVDERSINLR